METYSKDTIISLGRSKGLEILNEIKNAKKEVKIISPYLSPDYIKELIYLNNKGVDITLITCDKLETNKWSDFKPSDIIREEKIEDIKLRSLKKSLYSISMILFLSSIMSFPIMFFYKGLLFIPAVLLFISLILFGTRFIIQDYKYNYHSIFRLKVFDSKSGINPQSTNLIHSKIFLIDNKILFLGSANFTYSGFKTHYETIVKVEDEIAINKISDEVGSLFNSGFLKSKDIQEWGKERYE